MRANFDMMQLLNVYNSLESYYNPFHDKANYKFLKVLLGERKYREALEKGYYKYLGYSAGLLSAGAAVSFLTKTVAKYLFWALFTEAAISFGVGSFTGKKNFALTSYLSDALVRHSALSSEGVESVKLETAAKTATVIEPELEEKPKKPLTESDEKLKQEKLAVSPDIQLKTEAASANERRTTMTNVLRNTSGFGYSLSFGGACQDIDLVRIFSNAYYISQKNPGDNPDKGNLKGFYTGKIIGNDYLLQKIQDPSKSTQILGLLKHSAVNFIHQNKLDKGMSLKSIFMIGAFGYSHKYINISGFFHCAAALTGGLFVYNVLPPKAEMTDAFHHSIEKMKEKFKKGRRPGRE